MDRLIVELLPNRDRCGGISFVNAAGRKICGPFPVACRSSDNLAAANGNPQRDPLLRFGDTPTGGYLVRRILKSGKGTAFPASRLGPHGVIVTEPVSGDAASADANGRFHFLIIGGDLSSGNKLRSTAGSLRLRNDHLRSLIKALASCSGVHCDVVEVDRLPHRGTVHVDDLCRDDDPIDLPLRASQQAERLHDIFVGSTAVALGLVASFAIAPTAASAKPVVAAAAVSHDRATPIVPREARHSHYVRLAYGGPGPGALSPTLQQLQGIQENPAVQGGAQPGIDTAGPRPTGDLPSVPAVPPPVQVNPSSQEPSIQSPPTQPTVAPPPAESQPTTSGERAWQHYLQQQNQPTSGERAWQQYQQQQQQQQAQPQQPAQPAPAKTNTIILDKGAPPPPPSNHSNSSSNNGTSQ